MGEYKAIRLGIGTENQKKLDEVYAKGMQLVWENAAPTDSFAAQTVSLEIGEKDLVMIKYKTSAGYAGGNIFWVYGKVGDRIEMQALAHYLRTRTVDVTTEGLEFAAAKYCSYGSESFTTDNQVVIPLAVYVYKDFFVAEEE